MHPPRPPRDRRAQPRELRQNFSREPLLRVRTILDEARNGSDQVAGAECSKLLERLGLRSHIGEPAVGLLPHEKRPALCRKSVLAERRARFSLEPGEVVLERGLFVDLLECRRERLPLSSPERPELNYRVEREPRITDTSLPWNVAVRNPSPVGRVARERYAPLPPRSLRPGAPPLACKHRRPHR